MAQLKQPSSYLDVAVLFLANNEGFRDSVYQNKGDVKTAGYGFTSPEDLHNWTEPEARKRLRQMITKYDDLLKNGRLKDYYNSASDSEKVALIDLLHQGGVGIFNKMPKFVQNVLNGDYTGAYKQFDWGIGLTKTRTNKRRDLWLLGYNDRVNKPIIEDVNNRMSTANTQVPVNTSVMKTIPQQQIVDRYVDSSVPSSISWTAAYPEKKLNLRPTIKIPNLLEIVEQSLFKPTFTF